jgi:hypothetical protein
VSFNLAIYGGSIVPRSSIFISESLYQGISLVLIRLSSHFHLAYFHFLFIQFSHVVPQHLTLKPSYFGLVSLHLISAYRLFNSPRTDRHWEICSCIYEETGLRVLDWGRDKISYIILLIFFSSVDLVGIEHDVARCHLPRFPRLETPRSITTLLY